MTSTFSRTALIGATCATLFSAPAFGAAVQPVGGWTVNYSETQCTAERKFAQDGRALAVALSPSLDGSSFEVGISESDADYQLPQQIAGKASFGGPTSKYWALNYRDPATDRRVYRFRVAAETIRGPASTGGLSFAAGPFRANLEPLNMAGAVAALDTCLKDLREYWNAESREGFRPASPRDDVTTLLKPANHVDSEMWGGVKGTARYVLFIGADGKLAGCDAISDDASPVLALLGCDILRQRGQFSPGLDQAGAPVRSVIVTAPVRWKFD